MIQSIEDGRKEDGNRSIADKIIKRLHDLYKTIENNQGRWAWELLQNAKDSIANDENRTVSVQIELNTNSVEFRHNGIHFTEQDIRVKIIDDLGQILYPVDVAKPTNNQEGKILSRILFSSFVDNFETYLSELLYEIFLANPATLRSKQQVTIEEVLNCTDIQEFVKYWAKQKIGKLQKGSVKGFINDNKQISDLSVLDEPKQNEIEKILQIRHLYSHRNGIVDEKFLQYFVGQFVLNSEHQMSISEICDTLCYLSDITNQIDIAAKTKYKLANGS